MVTMTEEAINVTHEHYWKVSDVPGYFLCECGDISHQNNGTLIRTWNWVAEGGKI